ncbi:hypothetical protein ABK040_012339 [Willaertia magna]
MKRFLYHSTKANLLLDNTTFAVKKNQFISLLKNNFKCSLLKYFSFNKINLKKEEKLNFYNKEKGHYNLDRYLHFDNYLDQFINNNTKQFYFYWKNFLLFVSIFCVYLWFSHYFKNKKIKNINLFKIELTLENINLLTNEEIQELEKEINIIKDLIKENNYCKELFNENFLRNILILSLNDDERVFTLLYESEKLFKFMVTDGSIKLKRFIYNFLLNEHDNLQNKNNYLQYLIRETYTIKDYKAIEKLLDLKLIYFYLLEYKYLDLDKKEEKFKNDFSTIYNLLEKIKKNNKDRNLIMKKFEDSKENNLTLQNKIMDQLADNSNYKLIGIFMFVALPFYHYVKRRFFSAIVKSPLFDTAVCAGTYFYISNKDVVWNRMIDYSIENDEKISVNNYLQKRSVLLDFKRILTCAFYVFSIFNCGVPGFFWAYLFATT